MNIRIKTKEIYIFLAFFFLLFPSLQGSVGIVTGKSIYICSVLGVLFCYMYNRKLKKTIVLSKNDLIWIFLIFIVLLNNYDIKQGKFIQILDLFVIILFYIFLNNGTSNRTNWFKYFWDVAKVLCSIHFVLGLFFLANKSLLFSEIIPRFTLTDNGYNLLVNAINNGYMTGICNHYSKMGTYMALGTIAFSGVLFKTSRKKLEYVILLAFIIGLAMTGKRGPLLFTIIALFITWFIFSKKNLTQKKIIKTIGIALVFLIVFGIAYLKIPQISSIISRFMESDSLEEATNGRIDFFWESAISMFKDKPLFGYGWRSFRENSLNGNDAHNIYLQLLAETGIVGFAIFMIFTFMSLYYTYKGVHYYSRIQKEDNAFVYVKMAFAYQIFFILYGITGNPLYDGQCYIPYFICCIIGWTFYFTKRRGKKNEDCISN